MSGAVFTADGDGFAATPLARGPWDPNSLHGGAPAALLAELFERLPGGDDLITARLTYELLRPVPLARLTANVAISRPGKRVQLLEGSLHAPDGTEVVRARALRVVRASTAAGPTGDAGAVPPGPETVGDTRPRPPGVAPGELFAPDAVEIRFVAGRFSELGAATAWFRLRVPVIDDAEPSPLARVAAAADFGNGISAVVSWEDHVFINPDLTVHLERAPEGEWIALEATTRIAAGGIGIAESVLYDERGRIGRAVQSLLVARR